MSIQQIEKLQPGDWVRISTRNYGLVEEAFPGGKVFVHCPVQGDKFERWELLHDTLRPGAPTMFYQEIVKYAEQELGLCDLEIREAHDFIARGRDKMAIEVLYALSKDMEMRSMRSPKWLAMRVTYDKRGVEINAHEEGITKRLTYKQLEKEIQAADKACSVDLDNTACETLNFLCWVQQVSDPAGKSVHFGSSHIPCSDDHSPDDPNYQSALARKMPFFSRELVKAFCSQAPQKAPKSPRRSKAAGGASSAPPASSSTIVETFSLADLDVGTTGGALEPANVETTPQIAETKTDPAYDAVWDTIEQTAQQEDADIFAQFDIPEQPIAGGQWCSPPMSDAEILELTCEANVRLMLTEAHPDPHLVDAVFSVIGRYPNLMQKYKSELATFVQEHKVPTQEYQPCVTVIPDPNHKGTFCICVNGETVEQFFASEEEAHKHAADWAVLINGVAYSHEDALKEAAAWTANNVSDFDLSPEQLGHKLKPGEGWRYSYTWKQVEKLFKNDDETRQTLFDRMGIAEDNITRGLATEANENQLRYIAELYERERTGQLTTPEIKDHYGEPAPPAQPVIDQPQQTDAGLVDPETGELLEQSLILRKFGWTALPMLPKDREPTFEELELFEAKVDQVAERVASHRAKAARWREQTEKRCKPLDEAADFWWTNFCIPLAKQLAQYRLPRYQSGAKKGEFSKKTLHLSSCSIEFTKTGGYYVHAADEVRKHIEQHGIEHYKNIGAEWVLKYDHNKLIAALKSGSLKDIPGTGHKPENPLATVAIAKPSPKKQEVEAEDDSQ